ncbi:MAG TPA: asparagine synthase (glutamine-hydrolyzing) [Candidatus Paceibacterota bacterium]|nr:asparagine synthase (glutamine-hydrolyzing) [Candidatus Paceibacterota bacterium]
MCGIIGIIHDKKEKINKNNFKVLVHSLKHRGPDDWGILHEEDFSFGHRRLSVIDLSKNARQPMSDEEKNIFITYNGEIYNFLEIKDELIKKGHKFQSKSDTEVIIESYKEWGINCIKKFNGMFAFGLYDERKNEFYLVRDRLGIKPVYYSNFDNKFVFCSELKGIINCPSFKKELNFKAVSCFLSFRYCLGRETYFKNVFQLEPGHYMKIKNDRQQIIKYWDIDLGKRKKWMDKKYKRKIKHLIEDAVKKRTISDVPLGSYLSGGIDSTVILDAMSKNSSKPVKTFTVSFKEKGFDETYYSSLAAKKFKAENLKLTIEGKDYLKHMRELIKYKDQPLGMHNEVAVYLMAKQLKKYVTVVLSGEGADEIFSGYGRLFKSPFDYYKLKIIEKFPEFIQKRLIKITNLDKNLLGKTQLDFFLTKYSYFPLEEKNEIYNEEMKKIANNDKHLIKLFKEKFKEAKSRNFYDKINFVFEKLHLPGLLLMMDATSMATGVEVRVPFVDHRLVQETFNIPSRYKIKWKSLRDFFRALLKPSDDFSENEDTTKFILKEIYKKEIPEEIIERKKMVFPVPLNSWFKEDFNKLVKKELLNKNSKIKLVFNQEKLKNWIEKKEKGNDPIYGRKIWLILNLEYWLREYF